MERITCDSHTKITETVANLGHHNLASGGATRRALRRRAPDLACVQNLQTSVLQNAFQRVGHDHHFFNICENESVLRSGGSKEDAE